MPPPDLHGTRSLPPWAPLAAVAAAVAVFALWALRGIFGDPGFVFLLPKDDAQWISPPLETTLVATERGSSEIVYIGVFNIPQPTAGGTLEFVALRSAKVFLDGQPLYDEPRDSAEWKHTRRVTVSGALQPGEHTLQITCFNDTGPPMLRVHWPETQVYTNEHWLWIDAQRAAHPVQVVGPIAPPAVALEFPTVGESWRGVFPWVILACLVGAALSLFAGTPRAQRAINGLTASRLRWLLMLALLVVGVNNLMRHLLIVGADVPFHYQYIQYVADHYRLPPLDESLQAFQAPLYYVLSAALLKFFVGIGMTPENVYRALRILPMLCSLGFLQLSFMWLRRAVPESPSAQRWGLCLAAAFPLVLYKTPVVSNEPLAGVLGALAALYAMDLFVAGPERASPLRFAFGGALWGLAVLAKVSALVLAGPFLVGFLWMQFTVPGSAKLLILRAAIFTATCAAVCGWYFLRNQLLYGKMVIGGWDPLVQYEWWQFPGFRTPAQYLSFGEALRRPMFCMVHSVWDGLYAGLWFDAEHGTIPRRIGGPEWNAPFTTAALVWALVPTLALAVGAAWTLWPIRRSDANPDSAHTGFVKLFSVMVAGAYIASILGHTFVLPYYNSIKTTYALAAIPAFIVLIVAGVEPLLRYRWGRVLLHAWLAAWVLLVGVGYWAGVPAV